MQEGTQQQYNNTKRKKSNHHNSPKITQHRCKRDEVEEKLDFWCNIINSRQSGGTFDFQINGTDVLEKCADTSEISKLNHLIKSPNTKTLHIKIYRSKDKNSNSRLYDGVEITIYDDFVADSTQGQSTTVIDPNAGVSPYQGMASKVYEHMDASLSGFGIDGLGSTNYAEAVDRKINQEKTLWELQETKAKNEELEKDYNELCDHYDRMEVDFKKNKKTIEELEKENRELRKRDTSKLEGFFNVFLGEVENRIPSFVNSFQQNAGGGSQLGGISPQQDPEAQKAIEIWNQLKAFGNNLPILFELINELYENQDILLDVIEFTKAGQAFDNYALIEESH